MKGSRSSRRVLLAAAVAAIAGASVFLLSGAFVAGAAIQCETLSVLPPSNFEIDTGANGANPPVDGPAICIDWLASGSTGPLRRRC